MAYTSLPHLNFNWWLLKSKNLKSIEGRKRQFLLTQQKQREQLLFLSSLWQRTNEDHAEIWMQISYGLGICWKQIVWIWLMWLRLIDFQVWRSCARRKILILWLTNLSLFIQVSLTSSQLHIAYRKILICLRSKCKSNKV